MTTAYTLSDTLPKDQGGQKMIAWVNDGTSDLFFGLARGIGAETLGGTSKIVTHLGVGSHTIGSALGHSVGVISLGAYTEAPSAIGTGNAQALRADAEGALYTRPASGIISYSSASVETHVAGSALLHDLHVVFNDANVGDSITIDDGTNYKLSFLATAASQHFSEHFAAGLVFATSLKHTLSNPTTASVTMVYSQY